MVGTPVGLSLGDQAFFVGRLTKALPAGFEFL
jgi:hypothetical protein